MLTELCVVLFYDDVIGPRVCKLCVQIIHANYVIVDYNTSSPASLVEKSSLQKK